MPLSIAYLNSPCFEPLKKYNFQMGVMCTLMVFRLFAENFRILVKIHFSARTTEFVLIYS